MISPQRLESKLKHTSSRVLGSRGHADTDNIHNDGEMMNDKCR